MKYRQILPPQRDEGDGVPSDVEALIEKIRALPAERQLEVEDFVDFNTTKSRRLTALDRLLAIAPALEAAGAPPISEEEMLPKCIRRVARAKTLAEKRET